MADVVPLDPRDRRRPPRPPLLRKLVGDVLRGHRLRQRRTLADVAGSARVSVQYLSEVERGRKEASSEVVAAICAALRIDLSELLADAGRELTTHRTTVPGLAGTGRPRVAAARPARSASRPGDVLLLAA